MKTDIKPIQGLFTLGYTLDKHTISSTLVGQSQSGRNLYDTVRTEVGEAVFQLKYRQNANQAVPLATAIHQGLMPLFSDVHVIIPMAASTARITQPMHLVAGQLARLTGLPWHDKWLVKAPGGTSLKDLQGRDARDEALQGTLSLAYDLPGTGPVNVLVIDDLYQTGASIDAACAVLGSYPRIGNIYVAALTRKY